jgi:hypothetical protein
MSTGRPRNRYTYNKVPKDENLLQDLDTIASYIIGTQAPEDVSYDERDTLPEALAYAITYPESLKGVNEAIKKVEHAQRLMSTLHKKLVLMRTKCELSNKKVGDLK